MDVDVGLKIPECGEGVILRIKKTGEGTFTVYNFEKDTALEVARGLQLMADLHEKLRKEKP